MALNPSYSSNLEQLALKGLKDAYSLSSICVIIQLGSVRSQQLVGIVSMTAGDD